MPQKEAIATWFKSLQDDICHQLEAADGTSFKEDRWVRPGGGGGRTRVIEGEHLEKGGVNFSAVHGEMPEKIVKALNLKPGPFFASGVSLVLHPRNPHVPIVHMNVRYFETPGNRWWFGGGIDLTPHYINLEEARAFHARLKETCDRHDPEYYSKFKTWADDYFFLKHRGETRGVGGIFFDHLGPDPQITKAERLAFVQDVGNTFCPAYIPLLEANKHRSFGEAEKRWQYLRRGRYVEFNLVWDKGTKFGLDTDGRTESILMSLPPTAQWAYAHEPEPGSSEAETLNWLKKGVDWVSLAPNHIGS